MKALASIGITKALRFLWYGWYAWVLAVSLPPVRVWLMRLAGATIGTDTVIFNVTFANLYHYGFTRLVIGDRCFIGDEVMLDVRGGITLKDDVTLSNRTSVVTHINVGYRDHPLQSIYPTRESPVVFEDGAYVGTGAIVLPGVRVGRGSVVGAGAVVNRAVPAGVLVAGVPAREVKKIRS